MNVLFDGPPEVCIEGGLATATGTSGGMPFVLTMRLADALILSHRFAEAYGRLAAVAEVIPLRRHADTA